MKTFRFLAFSLIFGISLNSFSEGIDSIVGNWRLYKIIYESQDAPVQNPNAQVFLKLAPNKESTIYWTLDSKDNFCEAKGRYTWNGHLLKNTIRWTNPQNNPSCLKTPDITIGKTVETPAWIYDGVLNLDLGNDRESLISVWKNIEK